MQSENVNHKRENQELTPEENQWVEKNFKNPNDLPEAREWLRRNVRGIRILNGGKWISDEHAEKIRGAIRHYIGGKKPKR